MSSPPAALPGHHCQVFRADDLFVTSGVNQGDALGPPGEVCLGDVYRVAAAATPLRLMLERGGADGCQTVAAGSRIGDAGDAVHLLARYTLLGLDGHPVEALLLRHGSAHYILPLSPMAAQRDYTLIARHAAPRAPRLSDLVCVSFARGTMITLPSGRQCPIDALGAGDRVLTRDHGAQPVRWIGRATLRAVGAFAPVVIGKGALGNSGDLVVSQHHRMFLYLRDRRPDLPTAEVLVQARHLVDGRSVFVRDGGFVDYFSLVFDRHEIIYAEGISAESLRVTDATVTRLPSDLAEAVRAACPGLSQAQHFGTEAWRDLHLTPRPGDPAAAQVRRQPPMA